MRQRQTLPAAGIPQCRVHTTPHGTLTRSVDAAGVAERQLTTKLHLEMNSPDDGTVTFADLQIHPSVLQAVVDVGYESPSAIQAATIPALMAGSDVVGLAQTGTGKTAAFAVPILSKIDTSSKATQALVLAPTRELALQVAEAFSRYGAHLPQINVLPIYGGSSYTVQLAGLKRGAQVVVGTPGRVIDHLERGTLDLSRIDYLVLDEADEMLTMGFAEDVERILAETPEYKQVALFSATMPPAIRKLTNKYLHDPVEVKVESKTATAENISQRYIQVAGPRKMDALTRVLEVEPFEAMIVFVRTKQATEEVAEKLRARGFSAAAINGDIPQAQRERTIAALKDGGAKESTSWSPPTSPPAGWTSNGYRTCSTTTSRTTTSPMCTASGVPAGRAGRVPRCCSSRRENVTCSSRLRRRPGRSSSRRNCPASTTSTPNGWRNSPIRSPTVWARPASSCSAVWSRTTSVSTMSRWPISRRRWHCNRATAKHS